MRVSRVLFGRRKGQIPTVELEFTDGTRRTADYVALHPHMQGICRRSGMVLGHRFRKPSLPGKQRWPILGPSLQQLHFEGVAVCSTPYLSPPRWRSRAPTLPPLLVPIHWEPPPPNRMEGEQGERQKPG